MKKFCMLTLLLCAVSTLPARAEDSFLLKGGLWEFTVHTFALVDDDGELTDAIDPPNFQSECLVAEIDRTLVASNFVTEGCVAIGSRSTPNSLSVDTECVIDGVFQSGTTTAFFNEARDEMHGFMDIDTDYEGVSVSVQGLIHFKRVGTCEAN